MRLLGTRRPRTVTGLPPANSAKDEGEDEEYEGEDEVGEIERLPFHDGFHRWNEKQHAGECEQNGDELILPDHHALAS